MHRKVLHTSYAVKKTFRVRIRIRAQSKCCKNNHAWHKKKSCKQNTFLCFILFYMVLYLYGFVLVWFVLVWFVLVWFCICVVRTCVVCTCVVLYLYGFILIWFYTVFLLRPCGGAPAIQQGIADEAILTYYEM